MAATVQDLRDDEVGDPKKLRLRVNQVIKRVNDVAARWKAVRIASYRTGQQAALPAPGFIVAAVVLAGVTRTDTGETLTAAPWLEWRALTDGTLSVTVRGLSALPAQYAVNLVMFEGEGTK